MVRRQHARKLSVHQLSAALQFTTDQTFSNSYSFKLSMRWLKHGYNSTISKIAENFQK